MIFRKWGGFKGRLEFFENSSVLVVPSGPKGEGYVDLLMLFSTSLRLVEVIDDLNNHKQAMVVRAAYKMKDKARACVAVGG